MFCMHSKKYRTTEIVDDTHVPVLEEQRTQRRARDLPSASAGWKMTGRCEELLTTVTPDRPLRNGSPTDSTGRDVFRIVKYATRQAFDQSQ